MGLAIVDGSNADGIFADDGRDPGDLSSLIANGDDALQGAAEALRKSDAIDLETAEHLPILGKTRKDHLPGNQLSGSREGDRQRGAPAPDDLRTLLPPALWARSSGSNRRREHST
jgi:hypothetical protein